SRARSTGPRSLFPRPARAEPREKKLRKARTRPPSRRLARLYFATMRFIERIAKVLALFAAFGIAALLALRLHGGGLWEGLTPAIAANNAAIAATTTPAAYDLTQLRVVNEVLKTVRDRYVDPKRVKPKDMLLSALNYVQRDVAQVIVLLEESA